MRATCNPGRYPWIRDYFGIDNIGSSNKKEIITTTSNGKQIKRTIRFYERKY